MVSVKLNFATIETNLNYNAELIRAVVAIIVEDLPMLVEEMQSARKEMDGVRIWRAAHKIAGLASNFDAEPLSMLTNELQLNQPVRFDTELDRLISAVAEASRITVDELTMAYALGAPHVDGKRFASDESCDERT